MEKGFTLIELIVVVAILAILSVLSAEFLTGAINKYRLDTSAKELVSKLRLAKVASVSRNTIVVVAFDNATDSYYAYLDKDKSGTMDAGENYLGAKSGREITAAELAASSDKSIAITNTPLGVTIPVINPSTLSYLPPSGRLSSFPVGVSQAVYCFQAKVGDVITKRRLTITPVLGTTTLWESTDPTADCSAAGDDGGKWEEVYE